MIVDQFSEKIDGGGACLKKEGSEHILDLKKEKIINLFQDKGFLFFRGYNYTSEGISKFTDKFTKSYANDATRREIMLENKKIYSVDLGNSEMPLHSEASYSPSWPEIIWFFCMQAPKKSGWTTICDGTQVYKNMKSDTKKFFLANQIIYDLKIPFSKKINNISDSPSSSIRSWFIDQVGVEDCKIDLKKKELYLKQKRYGVVHTRNQNKLAFVNHIQIILERDPQLLSWKFENEKKLTEKMLAEIKELCKEFTVNLKWESNDFCMIDNQRFMHGRTEIFSKEKRNIVNLQTLKSNFAFRSAGSYL